MAANNCILFGNEAAIEETLIFKDRIFDIIEHGTDNDSGRIYYNAREQESGEMLLLSRRIAGKFVREVTSKDEVEHARIVIAKSE